MRCTRFAVLICLLAFVSVTGTAAAQGTSGSQFLGIGMGPRAVAMGGAAVATTSDGTALHWNPAGLVMATSRRVSLSHVSWLDDASYNYASFALPLGRSTWGLAVEQGGIEWDNTGDGDFEAGDFSGALGYARRLGGRIGIGGSLRYVSSTLGDDSAASYAFDLGAVYTATPKLTLGAALRNVGAETAYIDEGDPMPVTMVGGAAYRVRDDLLVAMDLEKTRDLDAATRFGVEYRPVSFMALRGGAVMEGDSALSPVTGGLGFSWQERWELDYAYRPSDLGGTHWLSVSAGLGGTVADPSLSSSTEQWEAPEETAVPQPNMTVLRELIAQAGAAAFDKMGLPKGSVVHIRQVDNHTSNWLVQSVLLEDLTGRGHVVKTGAAGGAPADEDVLEVTYRIISCNVTYPRSWREWLVGTKRVERRASVDIHFQVLDAEKAIVWAGNESREYRDIVRGSRVPDLAASGQDFASPEIQGGGWEEIVEPVVVAGIVGGLIYLFYTSKSAD